MSGPLPDPAADEAALIQGVTDEVLQRERALIGDLLSPEEQAEAERDLKVFLREHQPRRFEEVCDDD